jgi:HAD superfamily hydrolase (TIGR01459 family)
MSQPRCAHGLSALADHFDAFLVDQWGVLHDGATPYPGARDCLERLAAAGKRVIVVSNSGRRTGPNAALLAATGFPAACYTAVVTSGEIAWRALGERADPFFAGLGRRCLLFSRGGDRSIVSGLDLEPVATAEQADFILASGVETPLKRLVDYEPLLAAGRARDLPMICANPDFIGVSPDGLVAGPGAIARHYEAIGGTVRWIGKPYPEIYAAAQAVLGDPLPGRVAAIGDSLAHDVAGGKAAGLATVLVMSGIHESSFAGAADQAGRVAALRSLGAEAGEWPDWLIPAFRW